MSPDDPFQTHARAGAPLRSHLKAVHADAAGFTEDCASACRNRAGLNSYDWLAAAAEPPAGGAVLDLACGSGVLLELCRSAYGPDITLTGVDMSPAELALAAQRLNGKAVALHEGLAQSLGFAASGQFDAVLCHWALTLMDPLQPVLAEVRRVLRPGGVFAAIVDGPVQTGAGYGEICDLIAGHVRAAAPDYAELGDPRARDGDALAELARSVFPGAGIAVESDVFALEAAPGPLARSVAGFFYSSFMLAGPAHTAMLDDLTGFFARLETPRYEMPVNRLRIAVP